MNPVEVQKYLSGVDYPADKQTLIDKAHENGAPEDVIDILENIPEETFETPADVSEALGGMNSADSMGGDEDEDD